MSFEIFCPHCRTALLVEVGQSRCYACGQVIEVEAQVNPVARTAAAERVVRFLRGLLFDGELSGDEVWSLASWLNKQSREVCQQWPANVLVPLLQNVFEDGELSSQEMIAVASALVKIEREWSTRFAPVEDAVEPAFRKDGNDTGGVKRPLLPVVDYVGSVASSDGTGEYRVDLKNHICTCPDWVGWRRSAPPQDYKRACKHIARLYHALEIASETEDLMFDAFIVDHVCRDRGTLPQDEWLLEMVNGKAVLYGQTPGKPWVNIFAPQGSGYDRFGFNKEERRWSYGESPRGFAKFFRQKFQAP
jgi:hypothetical protein